MRSLRNSEIKKLKRGDFTNKKSFTVEQVNDKFIIYVSNSLNNKKEVLCQFSSEKECNNFFLNLILPNLKLK